MYQRTQNSIRSGRIQKAAAVFHIFYRTASGGAFRLDGPAVRTQRKGRDSAYGDGDGDRDDIAVYPGDAGAPGRRQHNGAGGKERLL